MVHEASSDSAPHKMLCKAASLDATLTIANALLFSNIERARQFALDFLLFKVCKNVHLEVKKRSCHFLTQLYSSPQPVGAATLPRPH